MKRKSLSPSIFLISFFPKGASMERARPRVRMANQTEPCLPRWKRCTLRSLSGCRKPTCTCRGCTRTGWRAWTPRRSRTLCTPPTVQWVKARAVWISSGNSCRCRAVLRLQGSTAPLHAPLHAPPGCEWGSAQLRIVLGKNFCFAKPEKSPKALVPATVI